MIYFFMNKVKSLIGSFSFLFHEKLITLKFDFHGSTGDLFLVQFKNYEKEEKLRSAITKLEMARENLYYCLESGF